MSEYFLSYSRADQAMALRFADDLIAAGVKVWVDQYDIAPSEHWDRTVEAALRACDGVVLVLSPHSAASPNVADEVSVAIDAKKHMIPVLIEACVVPLRLTRVQFIDATQDYEAALRRCLAAIKGGAPAAPRGLAAVAAASAIDPAAMALAEDRLAAFVGPIAGELVRRAAVRAQALDDFHDDLASRLPDDAARRRFLRSLGAPAPAPPPPTPPPAPAAPAPVSAEAIAALTKALGRHMGPIAAALVSREKAAAQSPDDLRQRLAARVPEHERADFLKETRFL
ncbi:MAG TPA: toll/interleukin-1 receptor domain-containing protein [Caulobacteraceae bacterium]|nr:toll/interleukin-1 receptor domain-containing protein [Caulobacteraceae bacterium]